MTPEVNNLGGKVLLGGGGGFRNKRFGLRSSYCLKQDFCTVSEDMYDFALFTTATSQADLCKINTTVIDENFLEASEKAKKLESIVTNEKPCEERTSNVRICPKELLKEVDNPYLEKINKDLRKLRFGEKKKKKKKRKTKKKKKKKKKDKKKKKKGKKKKEKKKRKRKKLKKQRKKKKKSEN